ncbi:uncharacterized protein LOC144110789 isoform X2 [Amblyomma americanum]
MATESSVEMQEVGRVSGVALACREYSPVSTAVPVVASKEWPTGQLAQRIRSQQQALSRQLGEMSLAATGESLDTLAAALRSCQVAHAQMLPGVFKDDCISRSQSGRCQKALKEGR